MRYRSDLKRQLPPALIGGVAVIALSYFMNSAIDWPTVIGVVAGIFLGYGFAPRRQSAEHDTTHDQSRS